MLPLLDYSTPATIQGLGNTGQAWLIQTVNSKFHLIQNFCEIFARLLLFRI